MNRTARRNGMKYTRGMEKNRVTMEVTRSRGVYGVWWVRWGRKGMIASSMSEAKPMRF